MISPLPTKEATNPNHHKCAHCGFSGPEVVLTIGYIGGLGNVEGYYCLDREACWQRWEARNGNNS